MKYRCFNKRSKDYKDYGGRGITICPRWLNSFENFLEDMGLKPLGHQIDRIDNNKGYSKENCRWVTNKINCRNRRTTKLTMEKANTIRQIKAKNPKITQKELAATYDVCIATISNILRNTSWH